MATIDVADCCLVCADPLEWTGLGPCGHKEICSRCVARMRFVLKDNNCVLCKQDCPTVFFTRFMGDYTARPGPADFASLKVRGGSSKQGRARSRVVHYARSCSPCQHDHLPYASCHVAP